MAGFSIPGLGLAKPNESLPPLSTTFPSAVYNSAPSTNQVTQIQSQSLETGKEDNHEHAHEQDAPPQDSHMADASLPIEETGKEDKHEHAHEQDAPPQDSLMEDASLPIDFQASPKESCVDMLAIQSSNHSSPASITFALEAALGGLSGVLPAQEKTEVRLEETPQLQEASTSDVQMQQTDHAESSAKIQQATQLEDTEMQKPRQLQENTQPTTLEPETNPNGPGEANMEWEAEHRTDGQQASQEAVELENDGGENPEWEVDSSPYESSSESSSSDSSDSDNDGYQLLGVEETARLLMEAEAGSDDETDPSKGGNAGARAARVRTKNELSEAPPPLPDIVITPEMRLEELGAVVHIVEGVIVIKAFTPGEYQVLDAGSVICTADRTVVGVVSETIGTVIQPMYTIRFAAESSDDDDKLVSALGLQIGTKLFYPTDLASYVFTQPLRNLKGSDASNMHDEEVGADEMEFSDDEKEAEHKRSLKQQKNRNRGAKSDAAAPRPPHPLRQQLVPDASLNYDDDKAKASNDADEDGPYRPLTRPPGFGAQNPSADAVEPPPRQGSQRGSRRGDHHRGKGGRGRNRGHNRKTSSHPPPSREIHAPSPRPSFPYSSHPQPMPSYSPQPAYPAQHTAQHTTALSWPQQNAAIAPPPPPQLNGAPMPTLNGVQLPPTWQPPLSNAAPVAPPPHMGWAAPAQMAPSAANGGTFLNPTLIAALMNQIQTGNSQQQWGPPPHPPPGFGR